MYTSEHVARVADDVIKTVCFQLPVRRHSSANGVELAFIFDRIEARR
jgi:hypothetical protein